MKLQYAITLTLCAFLVLVIYRIASKEAANGEGDSSDQALSLSSEKSLEIRNWLSTDTIIPEVVPFEVDLYQPLDITITESEIFVSDHPVRLLRFDKAGSFLNGIIAGRGQAPGELLEYTDITVMNDHVLVAAPNSRLIADYLTDGTHIANYQVLPLPYKIFSHRDSIHVYRLGATNPLITLAVNGTRGREYGGVISEQGSALEVVGAFTSLGSQGILYAPKWASYLFWFDQDGNLENVTSTFGNREFPSANKTIIDESNTEFRMPEQERKVWDVEMYEGVVWVSTIISEEPFLTIFDSYEVSTREYQGSLKVEGKLTGFAIDEGHIWAATDTAIVSFQLPPHSN